MGALDEVHYDLKLSGSVDLDFVQEPETIAIEDAVKVLLQSLGEDINREGLKKPLFVLRKPFVKGLEVCSFHIVNFSWFPYLSSL